jgi:ABC-type glycerol-3-phosphate transport system substrate-binding protein
MKRLSFCVISILLLLAAGFAWASGGSEAPKAETAAAAASKWKGEIRMQSGGYTPNVDRGPNVPQLHVLQDLADKYVKMYPGVKIEFVVQPQGTEQLPWLVTQLAGGTCPEIVYGHATELEQYAPEGWFMDWMPYLQKPNVYIPGNQVWYDTFGKKLVELRRSPNGALWSLPVNMVATIIYYNKDIFKQVGVTAPTTWDEFMKVSKKIQDAGITPMLTDMSSYSAGPQLSWSYRVFISHFYDKKMAQIDSIKADNVVSAEEFARAVKKKIIAATDPEHKAVLAMYAEWAKYWQKGFLSPATPGLFQQGKVAMWWQHINQLVPLLNDPLRKFELGTFYCPQVTAATSPYSTGAPMTMVGGASGEQWAITKTAMDKKTVDLCVDWIQFLTVPDNINALIEEAKTAAPLIKGGTPADMFKPFLAQGDSGVSPFVIERFFSTQQRDEWFREFQLFLSDKYTVDGIAARMQEIWVAAADELTSKQKYDQGKW